MTFHNKLRVLHHSLFGLQRQYQYIKNLVKLDTTIIESFYLNFNKTRPKKAAKVPEGVCVGSANHDRRDELKDFSSEKCVPSDALQWHAAILSPLIIFNSRSRKNVIADFWHKYFHTIERGFVLIIIEWVENVSRTSQILSKISIKILQQFMARHAIYIKKGAGMEVSKAHPF